MARSGLVGLVILAGCGARAALSLTTSTYVTCEDCGARPALVGRPVRLVLDWPSTEPESDGTVIGTLRWTIECVGAPCHVGFQREDQVAGDAMVEVIPDAPGSLVVRVVLDDGMRRRTVALAPFMVGAVDAIELTCTTRPPSIRTYEACGAEIPAGNDVRVAAVVRSGRETFDDVELGATIDGAVVASLTASNPTAGWRCGVRPSPRASGRPEMACASNGLTAGDHVLVTHLGGVEAALRLVVR